MSAKDHSPQRSGGDPPSDGRGTPEGDEKALSAWEAAERLSRDGAKSRKLDALHDILLSLLRRTGELGSKTMAQWRRFLGGAHHKKAMAESRKKTAEHHGLEQLASRAERAPGAPDAEHELLGGEHAAKVVALLTSLPPRELRVFLLTEWRRVPLRTAALFLFDGDGPDALTAAHSALVAARRRIARFVKSWSISERAALFGGVDGRRLAVLLERLASDLGLDDLRPESDAKKKDS